MKIVSQFTFSFFLGCFSFLASGQENKVHDSLLKIFHKMPKDSNRVEMLHDLYNSVLFNNSDLSKSYAEAFLRAANEYGTPRQVGYAYYSKAVIQRAIGDKDSHYIYIAEAKRIFQKENDIKGIINTDKAMAIIYDEDGRDDLAIQLLLKNIEREKIIKDTALLASDYKHLAGIYTDKTNYELALKYCIQALNFCKVIDAPLSHADALYQMGIIESGLGNQQNALANYTQALEIYIAQNDKFYQSLMHNAIGNLNLKLDDHEKAMEHFNKGLVLAREMSSPVSESHLLKALGRVEVKLKNFKKGLSYFEEALKLAEKNERVGDIVGISYQIANTQLLKNSYTEALEFTNKGLSISKSIKEYGSISDFYKLRSEIFESQNKLTRAIEDYKKHVTMKDSLYTLEKSKQIEELRTIYETEKKEQQIAQQETEIKLLEEREKISRFQKMALGGGLGLSALALGFGFYGFRQKTKRNKLEKEKVEAELAFKKKELTTHAMHLAKKNEVLEHVKQKAKELKTSENGGRGYQQLIQTINFDQQDDRNWENFTQYFEQVHKDFSKIVKTKYPDITKNELRLMALLKMNLSSKEIANILNISSDGVKKARQRLRKKMELSPEKSLEATVLTL